MRPLVTVTVDLRQLVQMQAGGIVTSANRLSMVTAAVTSGLMSRSVMSGLKRLVSRNVKRVTSRIRVLRMKRSRAGRKTMRKIVTRSVRVVHSKMVLAYLEYDLNFCDYVK